MPDDATLAAPTTDTIYIVQMGDSLSKLAQRFYGSPELYHTIAAKNGIDPNSILYVGSRLVIPAADGAMPTSPGGSTPETYNGEVIETVTTTAPRFYWYHDWRIWAGVGVAAVGLWYVFRKRR